MRTVINSDFKEGRQENTRPSRSSNAIFLWKTALRVYEKLCTELATGYHGKVPNENSNYLPQ